MSSGRVSLDKQGKPMEISGRATRVTKGLETGEKCTKGSGTCRQLLVLSGRAGRMLEDNQGCLGGTGRLKELSGRI